MESGFMMKDELTRRLAKVALYAAEIDWDYVSISEMKDMDKALLNLEKEIGYALTLSRLKIKDEEEQ